MTLPVSPTDVLLFRTLNDTIAHPWLDAFMSAVTDAGRGPWILLGITAVIVVWARSKDRWLALPLWAAVIAADFACGRLLKPFFGRPRPMWLLENVRLPVDDAYGGFFSFPSGHATNCFAAAVFLCLAFPKRWVRATALTAASVVGVSRVYVGVHFPSDVIAGAAFGGGMGAAAYFLWRGAARWIGGRSVKSTAL